MTSVNCFVPHCKNIPGQKNSRGELVCFFKPTLEQSREWLRLIGRLDSSESQEDFQFEICDAHFLEDDIVKEVVESLVGEEETFPRERKTLKPGANPCFFPLQIQPEPVDVDAETQEEYTEETGRVISPVSVKSEPLDDDKEVTNVSRLSSEPDSALDLFNSLNLVSTDRIPTVRVEKLDESTLARYALPRESMLERAMARKRKMDWVDDDDRRKRKIGPRETPTPLVKRKITEKTPQKTREAPKRITPRDDKKSNKGQKVVRGKSRKTSETVGLLKSKKVLPGRERKPNSPRPVQAGKAAMKRTGRPKSNDRTGQLKKSGRLRKNENTPKMVMRRTRRKDEEETSYSDVSSDATSHSERKSTQRKVAGGRTRKSIEAKRKKDEIAKVRTKKKVKVVAEYTSDEGESSDEAPKPRNKSAIKTPLGKVARTTTNKKEPAPSKSTRNQKILRVASSEEENNEGLFFYESSTPAVHKPLIVPKSTVVPKPTNILKPLIVPKPTIVPKTIMVSKPRPLILSKLRTQPPVDIRPPTQQRVNVKKENSPFIVPMPGAPVVIDLTDGRAVTNPQKPKSVSADENVSPMKLVDSTGTTLATPGREIKLTKVNKVPQAIIKQIEELIKKKVIPPPAHKTVQNGAEVEKSQPVSSSGDISIDASTMSITDIISNLTPTGIKVVGVQKTSAADTDLGSKGDSLSSVGDRTGDDGKSATEVASEGELFGNITSKDEVKPNNDRSTTKAYKRKSIKSPSAASVSNGQVNSSAVNSDVTPSKYTIHRDARKILLPGDMWGIHQNNQMTVFLQIDTSINVRKCVIFEDDKAPKVYCGTHEVQDFDIHYDSAADVQTIIGQIHRWKLCIGTKSAAFWSFAEGCQRYFTTGEDRRCDRCKRAHWKKMKKKMERLQE